MEGKMTQEVEYEKLEQGGWLGSCFLWFFWGASLSFMAILSIVLLVLLAASVTLNIYLGWEMAGLEVAVSRSGAEPVEGPIPIPSRVLAAIPTNTPTSTPTPVPTGSDLEAEVATLSAIATEVAASQPDSTPAPTSIASPTIPPTGVPTAVAIATPALAPDNSDLESGDISESTPAETPAASLDETAETAIDEAQAFAPPATSSNRYSLIPLEQGRDGRPPDEHGDLNLKLREPQPSNVEPALVDITTSNTEDPNSFKFSSVFEPNIVATYAVHDWDWGCNCKGDLLPEDKSVLVGLKTTPGEPIFIPKKGQDIYQGKYYAVVLYASEDSLTFVYTRAGTVAKGYTIHYEGLHTDPNLLALFRESKQNELPGLTLDTPVGVAASDELVVAVRDNGTFMDARSRKDWWD
jgi:hypothetical protein